LTAIVLVVSGCEIQVPEDESRDGQVIVGFRSSEGGKLFAVGLPLGDQPGVLFVALGGVVPAQIVVLAVDSDNGAPTGFVETVRRLPTGSGRGHFSKHGAAPKNSKTVHVPFLKNLLPHCPTRAGIPKSRFRSGLHKERERGFEPRTSSLGSKKQSDISVYPKALTATLSAACTAACTRFQNGPQANPLEVLADELRRKLSPPDLERLTEILVEPRTPQT
jgi:hypothetical protein